MPVQTTMIVVPTLDIPAVVHGDPKIIAALTLAGITSVETLTALTERELLDRNGIGPKTVEAIRRGLADHGLSLMPPKGKPKKTYPNLDDLKARWANAFRHVMGVDHEWTSGGMNSDNRAILSIYEAVGWGENPSPQVLRSAGDTVKRYLRHCASANPPMVPNLPDLARSITKYRQADPLVDATRARVRVDAQQQREDARMEGVAYLLNTARIPKETPSA